MLLSVWCGNFQSCHSAEEMYDLRQDEDCCHVVLSEHIAVVPSKAVAEIARTQAAAYTKNFKQRCKTVHRSCACILLSILCVRIFPFSLAHSQR